MVKPAKEELEISIVKIQRQSIEVCLLGASPLILNCLSNKTQTTLLLPPLKKTAADKASTLKHNPLEEFRASIHAHKGDDHLTRLMFPGWGFKAAMANAALDMPGVKKTEIGRRIWIEEDEVDIFGIPEMLMSVVRSADMNRTPDVRTRAIVRHWAARLTVKFATPLLKAKPVLDLLNASGMLAGIGDWRQQKGKGSFGQYEVCEPDDKRFKKLVERAGRESQDLALQEPSCFDLETERLYSWFNQELKRRGESGVEKKTKTKVKETV